MPLLRPLLLSIFLLSSLSPTLEALSAPLSLESAFSSIIPSAYAFNKELSRSAYETIQAEEYYFIGGLTELQDGKGNTVLGHTTVGGWTKYHALDFGTTGSTELVITYSAPKDFAGKTLTIRKDNKDTGPVLARMTLAATSNNATYTKPDWDIYQNLRVTIPRTTGINNIFFIFEGADAANFDKFTFIPSSSTSSSNNNATTTNSNGTNTSNTTNNTSTNQPTNTNTSNTTTSSTTTNSNGVTVVVKDSLSTTSSTSSQGSTKTLQGYTVNSSSVTSSNTNPTTTINSVSTNDVTTAVTTTAITPELSAYTNYANLLKTILELQAQVLSLSLQLQNLIGTTTPFIVNGSNNVTSTNTSTNTSSTNTTTNTTNTSNSTTTTPSTPSIPTPTNTTTNTNTTTTTNTTPIKDITNVSVAFPIIEQKTSITQQTSSNIPAYTPRSNKRYISPNGNDSNSGVSPDSPWKTLINHVSQIPANTEVIYADGFYSFSESVYSNYGSRPTLPDGVTIRAENIGKAILDASNTIAGDAFTIVGGNDLEIYGFTIQNWRREQCQPGTCGMGAFTIGAGPANNMRVVANTLSNIGQPGHYLDHIFYLGGAHGPGLGPNNTYIGYNTINVNNNIGGILHIYDDSSYSQRPTNTIFEYNAAKDAKAAWGVIIASEGGPANMGLKIQNNDIRGTFWDGLIDFQYADARVDGTTIISGNILVNSDPMGIFNNENGSTPTLSNNTYWNSGTNNPNTGIFNNGMGPGSGDKIVDPISIQTSVAKTPQIRSAYSPISTLDYSDASGIEKNTTYEGIEMINIGDWIQYDNIDFGVGLAQSLTVNLSLDPAFVGGAIEVRLDSLTSAPIATLYPVSTNSWRIFQDQSVNLDAPVTGVHTVYFTFANKDYLANLKAFQFNTVAIATTTVKNSTTTQSKSTVAVTSVPNDSDPRVVMWVDPTVPFNQIKGFKTANGSFSPPQMNLQGGGAGNPGPLGIWQPYTSSYSDPGVTFSDGSPNLIRGSDPRSPGKWSFQHTVNPNFPAFRNGYQGSYYDSWFSMFVASDQIAMYQDRTYWMATAYLPDGSMKNIDFTVLYEIHTTDWSNPAGQKQGPVPFHHDLVSNPDLSLNLCQQPITSVPCASSVDALDLRVNYDPSTDRVVMHNWNGGAENTRTTGPVGLDQYSNPKWRTIQTQPFDYSNWTFIVYQVKFSWDINKAPFTRMWMMKPGEGKKLMVDDQSPNWYNMPTEYSLAPYLGHYMLAPSGIRTYYTKGLYILEDLPGTSVLNEDVMFNLLQSK